MPQPSETMKLMRGLNNTEKRAVKAYRILTHAFYTSRGEALFLTMRYELFKNLKATSRAYTVASKIESLNWQRWCDEARAAGLR